MGGEEAEPDGVSILEAEVVGGGCIGFAGVAT